MPLLLNPDTASPLQIARTIANLPTQEVEAAVTLMQRRQPHIDWYRLVSSSALGPPPSNALQASVVPTQTAVRAEYLEWARLGQLLIYQRTVAGVAAQFSQITIAQTGLGVAMVILDAWGQVGAGNLVVRAAAVDPALGALDKNATPVGGSGSLLIQPQVTTIRQGTNAALQGQAIAGGGLSTAAATLTRLPFFQLAPFVISNENPGATVLFCCDTVNTALTLFLVFAEVPFGNIPDERGK